MSDSYTFADHGFSQFGFWYVFFLGIMVGSFLNVVIYRLPKALFGDDSTTEDQTSRSVFSCLIHPGSITPCCHQKIAWFDNIPLFSWLRLKGKCRFCAAPISPRYFVVELVTGMSFAWAYFHFGQTWTTLFYCLLLAILISLFWIDLETFYLPDYLTYSALWLGLLGSALGIIHINPINSILGACGGYLLPWSVNYLYWLWRKRDGFGGGDFKLLAVFGAWLGFSAIMPILAIASVLGLVSTGLLMLIRKEKLSLERMLPFGPFLIMAGSYLMMYGTPTWFFH